LSNDTSNWLWGDLISLSVPSDWIVNQTDDLIEITPPGDDGALHITILRRDKSESPSDAEARELVDGFVSQQAVVSSITYDAAGAHFSSRCDGQVMRWDVSAKVWQDLAILSSFCHTNGESAAAALIVSSIERA
jgi:hypothetical protein